MLTPLQTAIERLKEERSKLRFRLQDPLDDILLYRISGKADQIQSDIELLESLLEEQPQSLTENQIAELAQIGSQHLYLGEMDEGRLSYGGVIEIITKYNEMLQNTNIDSLTLNQ